MHSLTGTNGGKGIEQPVRQRYISYYEKIGGPSNKPYITDIYVTFYINDLH